MKRTLALALAALLIIAAPLAAAPGAGASRIVVREAGNRLVAVPASGGPARLLARAPNGALVGSSASANGSVVAFTSRTSGKTSGGPTMTDRIWVRRAGARPQVIRTVVSVGRDRQFSPVDAISLSPDGRRLLATQRGGTVLAMRADGTGVHRVAVPGFRFSGGPHPNGSGAKFTPDGHRIIAALEATTGEAEFECGVALVPLGGGSARFLRTGRKSGGISRYTAPALSPDGHTVAFLERLRDRERLLVMRLDGSGAHEVARPLSSDWSLENPVFSPSGRALAFVADRVFSGGTIAAVSPSRIYTVRASGQRLRIAQAEKVHRYIRNPTWVR